MNGTKICVIDSCIREHKALGYCMAHYKRFKRYGDADIKRPTKPAAERFWAKVDKRGPDECWPWTGGVQNHGYGAFHPTKAHTVLAHRYVYEAEYGPIAAADVIDHTCHNGQGCPPGPCEHRLCCNPTHLDPTSRPDNVNRSHNSNIQKTHCPRGHAYTPENTIHQKKQKTTSRVCRKCTHMWDAIRRAKSRAIRATTTKAA